MSLTPREIEVTALLARFATNREIAAELVISEGTAKRHVENILVKLGLRSRTQVADWASEQGVRLADLRVNVLLLGAEMGRWHTANVASRR